MGDIIDVTPSSCLSDKSSQDGNGVSEDEDLLTSFLDSFAQRIERDVNDAILKVDVGAFPIVDPDTEAIIADQTSAVTGDRHIQNENTAATQIKSNLRKRWERILGREKERHRRRNRIGSKTINLKYTKSSIEEQWDDAFRRYGYRIIPRSYEGESAFGGLGIVNDEIAATNKKDESQDVHLSPIFRFLVNEQLCLEDFETLISDEGIEDNHVTSDGNIEIQPVILNNSINKQKKKGDRSEIHHNSILRTISLLVAMKPEDWRRFDSGIPINIEIHTDTNENSAKNSLLHNKIYAEQEFVYDGTNFNEIHSNMTKVREFLQHVTDQKYGLTTSIVNLLLAHLVASTEIESKVIGDGCLQIFEEMKMLAESGQCKCRPDSTTYRILILAFSRRLQGMGEAVKLSQEMMESSSIDITPELLNEALRACHAKTELTVAKILMNSALSNHRVRINVGSCILFTEMLKTRKLDQEAIDFFSRIQQVRRIRDERR